MHIVEVFCPICTTVKKRGTSFQQPKEKGINSAPLIPYLIIAS
jgi:hypothetical protein